MKTNKLTVKVLGLTLGASLMFGGVAGALVYHINDAAERLKGEYKAEVEQYNKEKEFKIKNDVSSMTQDEIKRMENETREYLNQRLAIDYQSSLNAKSQEIIVQANVKIEEVKEYIDTLFE